MNLLYQSMREVYIRETHIADGGAYIQNDMLLKHRPNNDGISKSTMHSYGAGFMSISTLPPPHMVGPTGPIAKPNYFDSHTRRIHKPKSKERKKASKSKSHHRPFGLVSHRIPQPTHASPTPISGGNPIVNMKLPHKESSNTLPSEIESISFQSDTSQSDDNLQASQSAPLSAAQPDAQDSGSSEGNQANQETAAVSGPISEDLSPIYSGGIDEVPAKPASQPPSPCLIEYPNIIDKVLTTNNAYGLQLEEIQQRMACSHPDYKYLGDESFSRPLERVLESQKHFIANESTEIEGKVWCRLHYSEGEKLKENINNPILSSKTDYLSNEKSSRESIPEFEVAAKHLTASDVVCGAFLARPNPSALSTLDICRVITLLYGDLLFPDLETEVEHVLKSSSKFTEILMSGSRRYILNDYFIRPYPFRSMILQEQLKMRILNGDHEIISSNSFFYPKYSNAQLETTVNIESQTLPSNVQASESKPATTGESISQQCTEAQIPHECEKSGTNHASNTPPTVSEVRESSKAECLAKEGKTNETSEKKDALNKTGGGSKVQEEKNEEDTDSECETSDDESSTYELDDEGPSSDESGDEEEEEEEEEPEPRGRPQRRTRQQANMKGKRLSESGNARFERWKARIMYKSEKATTGKTGRRRA